MFNFNPNSPSGLNSRLDKLDHMVLRTENIFFRPSKDDWDEIFKYCSEIAEDFKHVRYPTKADQEVAWRRFYELRNSAFTIRNKQFKDRSSEHRRELMSRLNAADFDALLNFLGEVVSMGLLKTTAEEMKAKGRDLRSAIAHFRSVKHEMTNEHKSEVHERIIEVQKHHAHFWEVYNSHKAELSKIQEEKQRVWEEKQKAWKEKQEKSRMIKERIEGNLANNLEKLHKAQRALDNFKSKRDALQDKIDESSNENWKSKAEVWLEEFNEKIRSIEDQIERLENWIAEDQEKLRNWK